MPTVTFCNELNDDKIGYPSYVPRATHRFTFDYSFISSFSGLLRFRLFSYVLFVLICFSLL